MALTWKSFDFFEVAPVKLADDETRAFFESNDIASVCCGSDNLFLGSSDGYVRIVGPSWKVVRSFLADDGGAPISHMRQVEGTSLLVTIAGDTGEPVLKVWALDKPVKKTGVPTCLSEVTVNNKKLQYPVSAFAATEDLSQIAVGFANGSVTVIRGDLIHDRGAKQRIVHESEEPITGVELHVDEKLTTLFIATTARILKLVISGRGQGQPPRTVEDLGCAVGCMTVDKRTGDIIVARDDAIYFYTLEGRGPPSAYESPKRLVSVHQDYIALASRPGSASVSTNQIRRQFGGVSADAILNATNFTLLQPELRIIAHTESVLSQVEYIFQIWGDLYTINQQGQVYRYHEKTLQQRLEMLYQRNLYNLAVEVAQKCGMDAHQQNTIFRKYGDYQYQKGNYDEAMTQYIKAIDSTEPSQVIRKFLDTQRIHNLIEYLEELHECHKATSDHTTLLLNCYAKLKDLDKLEKFIKSPGDPNFDPDTAIAMCRQGGYFEQAAYLAKKHRENDIVVDILIEDCKAYDEALDFIWHLEPSKAHECLMKYARVLIENCPKDATQVFVDYYTGKYRPKVELATAGSDLSAAGSGRIAGGAVHAVHAVQNMANLLPLPYMNTAAVAPPAVQGTVKPTVSDGAVVVNPEVLSAPTYKAPPPRTAFSSFIDHPDEFIVFLEACLKEESLPESDKKDLYTTLFEMYLHKSTEKKGDQHREEWEQRAKTLIDTKGRDQLPIENSNVLLLSHLSNFRDGTTLVKEQSGLHFDIFRSYTSAKDTRGAIKALRKYGPEEPQLYPAALAYLTSDARVLADAGPDELAAVLARIDRDNLLAPLQVVQMLSRGGVATMGLVKPYLTQRIERERKDIAANRRNVAAFRAETDQRRAEIKDLASKPAVFQATRCAACTMPLDLPVVHFLCKHSFHQRCLRDGAVGMDENGTMTTGAEIECPVCAKDNETIRALRRNQEERAGNHELFRHELERSEDRFRTIADWFGRGVMNASSVDWKDG